jgi:polyisoprenoid-binding protein YceI
MRYKLQRGQVEVKARSTIHDTTTRFAKLEGTIDFDADATAATHADLALDMRVYDAGDRLTNWKLKSELEPDKHPTATFTFARFAEIHEVTGGNYTAVALGQLAWRGKVTDIKVKGKATVDRRAIEATASFELNVRALGITPPKILMLKVEDVVLVQVSFFAGVVEGR